MATGAAGLTHDLFEASECKPQAASCYRRSRSSTNELYTLTNSSKSMRSGVAGCLR